jgi:SpoVK/Ycf46/Vps4 family AAA+-type ATPase
LRRIITDDIRPRYTKRALTEFDFETLPVVLPEDVDLSLFAGSTDSLEACLGELNRMVGLDNVKQGIATMANNTRFFVERRRRGLPTSGNIAYHAIFTGNPGTGKTTVARMLGRIYHSLGLLSRGEVMAVDRTRLVGRYIGETEENMKVVLEEARGNVLFIDEAYNLYDGSGDRKDFGARVIDSLLTTLSQPNPDMMVIFAGYEKEMDAMLNTNPGLMGRFPYKYRFSDYNPEQLMEIAIRLLERDAYILSDEAAAVLKDSIAQAYKSRTANFSNARWVEQFVNNGIIPAMADRLASTPSDDYQRIEASDIRKAYEQFNPKAVELKPRRQVGFSA